MTKESDTIQLSHLEQTIYFASQRQGVHLLDADFATDLVGISRKHAVNLLASMAQKGRHLWEWTTLAENQWTHDGRKLTTAQAHGHDGHTGVGGRPCAQSPSFAGCSWNRPTW